MNMNDEMNFRYWADYFDGNRYAYEHIMWPVKGELTKKEKKCIASSLQQFQRGEYSEGKHLYQYAKEFGNRDYLIAIRDFIKEEQRHALILARFMEQESIPRIKDHWVDGVFRWLRNLFALEFSLTILVTAEIIAKVYYQLLLEATGSKALKSICEQILNDEEMHLRFQAYTLGMIASGKSSMHYHALRFTHFVIMSGTAVLVYFGHRKVIKAGGSNSLTFIRDVYKTYFSLDTQIGYYRLKAKLRDLRLAY